MARRSGLIGALLTAGCLGLPAIAQADGTLGNSAFGGPWDMVSFEMKSWGHPVTSWTVLPDGSGGWAESVRAEGAAIDDYEVVWHELAADDAGEAQLADLLAGLPFPAPSADGCENFMTDMPYGTISVTKGAQTLTIAYNSGCLDDAYADLLSTLRAANDLVSERGKAGPETRREPPSP